MVGSAALAKLMRPKAAMARKFFIWADVSDDLQLMIYLDLL